MITVNNFNQAIVINNKDNFYQMSDIQFIDTPKEEDFIDFFLVIGQEKHLFHMTTLANLSLNDILEDLTEAEVILDEKNGVSLEISNFDAPIIESITEQNLIIKVNETAKIKDIQRKDLEIEVLQEVVEIA